MELIYNPNNSCSSCALFCLLWEYTDVIWVILSPLSYLGNTIWFERRNETFLKGNFAVTHMATWETVNCFDLLGAYYRLCQNPKLYADKSKNIRLNRIELKAICGLSNVGCHFMFIWSSLLLGILPWECASVSNDSLIEIFVEILVDSHETVVNTERSCVPFTQSISSSP